jgi:hypothetical protein
MIAGVSVKPKEWGLNSNRARLLYQQEILLKGDTISQYLSTMLAIVLAPEYFGKGWDSHIDEMKELVANLPVNEAVPLAYFFLRKQVGMKRNGQIRLSTLLMRRLKMLAVTR